MIPLPGKTLTDIAVRIATHLMPAVTTQYGQADAGLISGLLLTMAQDMERAVYNRMADIEEIRTVCAQCCIGLSNKEPGLPIEQTLQDFIDAIPTSLHLADVTALHARAFTLLIDIHAWAEQHDPDLNLDIWRLLRRHSERNKFDIPSP